MRTCSNLSQSRRFLLSDQCLRGRRRRCFGELLQVCCAFLLLDNASRRGLCLFYERNDLLTACATSVFEAELQDVIPICHATIAGTRIIGRLIVGYVRHFI